jgi:SAM-dependent methyltransferase
LRRCLRCEAEITAADWHCSACGNAPQRVHGFPAFAPALAVDNDGYDDSYFAELFRLESGNYWFRARNALLIWALQRYFPRARDYLEIGCGTGYVLSGVAAGRPDLKLHASEISSRGLPFAAGRVPQAELLQMDARAIPFAAHFDIIGMFDVLEHIEDDRGVLAQAHRALQPGGGLIITVPQHRFLWSRYDEHAHHVRRYAADEIAEKVTAAGFRIIMTTSFVSLLLPLMLLSRRARPAPRADYDVLAELKVGALTNTLLAAALAFERGLIRCGFRFPAGGSRLLLAQRMD